MTNAKWVPWACDTFYLRAKDEMKCCLKLRTSSIIMCCFRFSLRFTNQFNKSYSFSYLTFFPDFSWSVDLNSMATCVWTVHVYEATMKSKLKNHSILLCRLNQSSRSQLDWNVSKCDDERCWNFHLFLTMRVCQQIDYVLIASSIFLCYDFIIEFLK